MSVSAKPPPPQSTRASYATLPMFFGEAHRMLGAEVAEAVASAGFFLGGTEEDTPASALGKLESLRIFGLLVPAALGGRPVGSAPEAVDVRALCLAREALAYASPMADSIFAVQGLGAYPAVLAKAMPARERFLAEVVAAKRVGAFALTEPEAGSDVGSMTTVARKEGESWVIDGDKCLISNVGLASHFIVFANADPGAGKRGISAFLVLASAAGVVASGQRAGGHPLGTLHFHRCRVDGSALIGSVGDGLALAFGTLDVFRTSVGAAAVGMARRALDETIAHVRRRRQFGKALAEFQMTQAALADMATELEAARLLVYRAAWGKDQRGTPGVLPIVKAHSERPARADGAEAPGIDVAMAKMFATEAAHRIIDRAVQLHGGSGVLEGSVVAALYRDIRPLRIYEGTTEIQKLIIGSALTRQTGEGPSAA